eukprot:IDg2471t1
MSDSDDYESDERTSSHKLPCFNAGRRDDYGLWRLRLRAACRAKGVWRLVDPSISTKSPPNNELTDSTELTVGDSIEKLEKACALIISALGNTHLRVIQDVDDDPRRMLQLLDERYASSRAASRIAVQTQVYRKVYGGGDMAKFIDEFSSLFSKLDRMGEDAAIPESHKAPMLLVSIPVESPLELTAAALRTKDVEELTWEYVAFTLIDESRARKRRAEASGGSHITDGDGRAGRRKGKSNGKKMAGTKNQFGVHGDIYDAAMAFAAAWSKTNEGSLDKQSKATDSRICDFCGKTG